jgi:hypothetical protein
MKFSDKECLFKIHRVKNENGAWCPAIEDIAGHDVDPTWIAGVLYALFSRYLENIPDSKQLEYENQVKVLFDYMTDNGHGYIERLTDDIG